MDSSGSSRQRWTEDRKRKEPTLYDEYLSQEKASQNPRRKSVPLRPSDTTSAAAGAPTATIRAVTPEDFAKPDVGSGTEGPTVPDRGTTSLDRSFMPYTTTTVVGGTAADNGASAPRNIPKPRKLVKEREWAKDSRFASHSLPNSRNGSSVAGMLARNSSKSKQTVTATSIE